MESTEAQILWSGVLEKQGSWTIFSRWQPKLVRITPEFIEIAHVKSSQIEQKFPKSEVIDVHYGDLTPHPLQFVLIFNEERLAFRCETLGVRDECVRLLKPGRKEAGLIAQGNALHMKAFLLSRLGPKKLLLQKIILRKYSTTLFKALHQFLTGIQRSQSIISDPSTVPEIASL